MKLPMLLAGPILRRVEHVNGYIGGILKVNLGYKWDAFAEVSK